MSRFPPPPTRRVPPPPPSNIDDQPKSSSQSIAARLSGLHLDQVTRNVLAPGRRQVQPQEDILAEESTSNGLITHISSLQQLNGILSESKDKLSVIDFHATWCPPCRAIAPAFEALSKQYTNVNFLKCDVDKAKDVARHYGVSAMPTFVFLKGDTKVHQVRGADIKALTEGVRRFSPLSVDGTVAGKEQTLASSPVPAPAPPDPRGPPPPIPPRWTRPNIATTPSHAAPEPAPDVIKALSRPPPPPPKRNVPVPALPMRRIPPPPTRLPTPPPEPEFHEQSQDAATGRPEYGNAQSCLKCHDFSHIDAHAALFPRESVDSLQTLAYALTDPFPSATDKARAIFTWLHHNIAYDTQMFFSGRLRAATPESTLQSGLAVCEGYAGLFKQLADEVGLESVVISGHGKGFGYVAPAAGAPLPGVDSNHAWNAVCFEDGWHLIDSCWGAGVLEGTTYTKRFDPSWFSSTPTEFGRRHFPTDPTHQLLPDEEPPVLWEAYICAPEGPLLFGDFHRLEYHPELVRPYAPSVQGGQRVTFRLQKRCEHMSVAEADNYVAFVDLGDGQRVPLQPLVEERAWSVDVSIPARAKEVSVYFVTVVDGRDAFGMGVQAFIKANGRKAMAFGGLCRWTVV